MQSSPKTGADSEKKPLKFRLIRWIANRIFPDYSVFGAENLPEDPCVIVGNHAQIYGPLAAELRLPRGARTWCIGEMMDRKEVPDYAFGEFWSGKPRRLHWYYRAASYAIARPVSFVLSSASTIPVYHDQRIITTFRRSVQTLEEGKDVVIFPEKHEPYNGILCQFQEHFADLARLYYRRTGTAIAFVPMYTAPRLKGLYFGKPVRFMPENSDEEERKRICAAMQRGITELAVALPRHTVVPYENIPKDQYPENVDNPDAGAL